MNKKYILILIIFIALILSIGAVYFINNSKDIDNLNLTNNTTSNFTVETNNSTDYQEIQKSNVKRNTVKKQYRHEEEHHPDFIDENGVEHYKFYVKPNDQGQAKGMDPGWYYTMYSEEEGLMGYYKAD